MLQHRSPPAQQSPQGGGLSIRNIRTAHHTRPSTIAVRFSPRPHRKGRGRSIERSENWKHQMAFRSNPNGTAPQQIRTGCNLPHTPKQRTLNCECFVMDWWCRSKSCPANLSSRPWRACPALEPCTIWLACRRGLRGHPQYIVTN